MRAILASLLASTLAACATPYDLGRRQNGDLLSYNSPSKTVTQIDSAAIIATSPVLTATQAKELASTLLDNSDVYCQDYLVGVSVVNNTTTSALDLAALTLSSVAPITTPAGNKNILSTISAIATGSKSALTNDILGGKDYGLIHDAIIAGRKDERKSIQQDIDANKFKGWSEEAILAHMQPYHVDCGIEFGLQYLRATVTKQGQSGAAPTAADTASATAARAKAAAAQAAATSTQVASAKVTMAEKSKDAADKAKAVAAAAPLAKAQAMADATSAQEVATQTQAFAESTKKAEAAAKLAADDWAEAAIKADAAAKAYAAADAATTASDAAAKEADDLGKALSLTKAPL